MARVLVLLVLLFGIIVLSVLGISSSCAVGLSETLTLSGSVMLCERFSRCHHAICSLSVNHVISGDQLDLTLELLKY